MSGIKHPNVGSVWRHHKGDHYAVVGIANGSQDEVRPDFPVTVLYCDVLGNYWARPVEVFLEKFVQVPAGPADAARVPVLRAAFELANRVDEVCAYAVFAATEVGGDRIRAANLYEIIRTARRCA